MKIPKIYNKTEMANAIYPHQKQAKATLNNKLNNNQGRELNDDDLEKLLATAKKGVKDLKIQMAYAWEYLNDDEVLFYYLNDKTDTVDRQIFKDDLKEASENVFHHQVDADRFERYTPSKKEYNKVETDFWNKYFEL